MSYTTSNGPLWRLSWRRLRRRPLQALLLVFGVAIGVAMMVSIDLANSSARRAFALSTDAVTGTATHRIVPRTTSDLDQAVYVGLRRELGFSPAAPVVEGYVLSPQLGDRPLRLVGVDPFVEPPFRGYFGRRDGAPQADQLTLFLTEPGALIIGGQLADDHGLSVGDTVSLDVSGRTANGRIVGLIAADDDATSRALQDIIFTDIASAQEILNMRGRLSRVDLIVDDAEALTLLQDRLPQGVAVEPAASQQNSIRQMTAAFELNLSALSLLALVVGMFLIYNTVTFSVVQRRPMFGIMRCLGVTGGQLFRLIIAESMFLSLIGAILGLLLGILLGRGLVGLVTQTINDFYFVVNVQGVAIAPESLLRGLLVGVAAALMAALIPALEASRTTPTAALQRSSLEQSTRRFLPWLWPVAGALLLTGAILLWLPAGLVVTFAGLFLVLIGAALLTPPLTELLMRLVGPLSRRLFGILGHMAARDIVRSLSRTSVAIAALMTAVSVVVGVSIMIGSFRGTIIQWLDQTLQADIYISSPGITANRPGGELPQDVVNEIVGTPGVASHVVSAASEVYLPSIDRRVDLIAVDGDISQGNRSYVWTANNSSRPWEALSLGEGVIISETFLRKENLPLPPPPLLLETPAGALSFPVLAVFYDYSSDQGTIMIDRRRYVELWGDDSLVSLALFVEPGVTVESLVGDLQERYRGRRDLLIQSNQALRRGSLEVFDRTFAITSALRLLAVLVAFVGVLSALMSLQLERSRELGILRATGMTVRQLWTLTFIETGLMGGTAGLLAIPVGFVLAWILIYVINVRSFGWTLQMQLQPAYFVQAFVVALVAALLAGVYPAWRIGRTIIATAIREE